MHGWETSKLKRQALRASSNLCYSTHSYSHPLLAVSFSNFCLCSHWVSLWVCFRWSDFQEGTTKQGPGLLCSPCSPHSHCASLTVIYHWQAQVFVNLQWQKENSETSLPIPNALTLKQWNQRVTFSHGCRCQFAEITPAHMFCHNTTLSYKIPLGPVSLCAYPVCQGPRLRLLVFFFAWFSP